LNNILCNLNTHYAIRLFGNNFIKIIKNKLMKNLRMLVLAALVLFGMAACKKGGGTVHRSGSGPVAKIGDIAVFDFVLKKDGKELFSTAQQGQSAKSPIDDPKKIKDPIYHFLLASLLTMKKGDSTTFTMKLDTFKIKPQGLDSAKNAEFVISLKDLMTETQFIATLNPQEKEGYMAQKKQMVVQERAEGMKDQIKAAQAAYEAAKPVFMGRAKAVADSMNVLSKSLAAGTMANVQTTASGLKYVILKEGKGAPIGNEKFAFVNYYGCLKDGKKFDESFERGSPLIFPVGVGQVIPGWDEGVALMKEGSTVAFLIPSNLAYGAQDKGTIPPNSDLVFYVELLKAM
jgi:FKBP-type peptidyl-prolyl cis-trans isomerase FkpA